MAITSAIPFARETLTVSNAVKLLSASIYIKGATAGLNQNGVRNLKAHKAVIRVDTAGFGVRCTRDGTTPVAGATGEVIANTGTLPLPAGQVLEIVLSSFGEIAAFQMIREGGSD